MFSAGDEFMDMTQSHTVNIASGSLAPSIQNRGKIESTTSLPERKNETLPGSSANGLDSGFKNFLASLSKSAPGSNTGSVLLVPPTTALFKEAVDTNSCLSQTKTDVCKQSLNTTRSFGGLLGGGAENPENDVSMDMTEAQTGHITGWDEGDVYLHCEGLKRAEKSSEEKISGAPGSSNNTGTESTNFNFSFIYLLNNINVNLSNRKTINAQIVNNNVWSLKNNDCDCSTFRYRNIIKASFKDETARTSGELKNSQIHHFLRSLSLHSM